MAVLRRITIVAALASAAIALAGCERKITKVAIANPPSNCFECHGTSGTAFVAMVSAAEAQWENSRHGSGRTVHENESDCNGCHTSEGFTTRASGGPLPPAVENPTAISCLTCHGPHPAGNGFPLRWTAQATLKNGVTWELYAANLCAACHQARGSVAAVVTGRPTLSASWGPHHSPQADMLIGSNGYEYAGHVYDSSPHRDVMADGCLDCHMRISSGVVLGGHSFNMAWNTGTAEIRNTAPCEPCHGTIADFSEIGPGFSVQDSVQSLIGILRADLVSAGLLDDASGLPNPVATSRDSAGAVWNYLIASQDRSLGVHNRLYIMGLLESAIGYMKGALPMATRGRAAR